MKEILNWILPPIVGAFIGYSTNVVAIRMLFRPLRKIRLFGLRLPFTPGILPKERHKLADSIGRMVEQELLTPGVIRERLAKTEVREQFKNTLGAATDQMLERPLSYWLEDQPDDFPMAELLKGFVSSDVFDSFLEEIVKNWMLGKPDSWNGENGGRSWLKSRFRDFGSIFVPTAKNLIKSGLVREIKNHDRGEPSVYRRALETVIEKYQGITLGEFLSIAVPQKQRLDSFLAEKAEDALDDNIEGALSSVNVKMLVQDRIDSLDMLRVEKIILDVMADQFTWIDIFGGILGALIGFMQVGLSLLLR